MDAVNRARILVVDDDRGLLRLVQKALRSAGYDAATASSGAEATAWLGQHQADLMLLDLKLEDVEGQELINRFQQLGITVPFIIITGQGDERVAVNMMKRGALDYLVKDVQFLDYVPAVISRALAQLDREKKLKAAEEALRLSEERFRVALKNSPVLVFSQDAGLHYTWVHNAPPGIDEADFLGKTDDDLFSAGDALRLTRIKRAVLDSGVGAREQVQWTVNQVTHIYDLTIEPIRDASGKIVGITGAAMDITERKRLEQEISQVSEMEQHRIGQDLHDGICQHLAGIELMSQVLEQNLEKKSKTHAAQAAEIARNVRETIAQTRSLARGLSPVVLESEGLMSALHELADNTSKLFRVNCGFICEKPVLIPDNKVATHLYRIAQEAVSNAIRHGKARQVEITLRATADRVFLSVRDYGIGFSREAIAQGGMGLRIMRYRAEMIGGLLQIQHEQPGTSVICSVPKLSAASSKTRSS